MRVDPNELIDRVVRALNDAEILNDLGGLIEARRLLNNDLRQAIDQHLALVAPRLSGWQVAEPGPQPPEAESSRADGERTAVSGSRRPRAHSTEQRRAGEFPRPTANG